MCKPDGYENIELCYHKNLLKAVAICGYAGIELDCENLSEDQAAGLEYALCLLKESEQEILWLRYGEGMSYRCIGDQKGISATRAGQIHARAVWKLRQPSCHVWYVEGYRVHYAKRAAGAERIRQCQQKRESAGILEQSCMKLGIPYGMYTRLQKAGFETIGKLQKVMKRRRWQESVRGVGEKQADIIVSRMMEMGLISEDYAAMREYRQRRNNAVAQDRTF